MTHARTLTKLIETVVAAEGAGWDETHPRQLARARRRLWVILWTEDRELAVTIYGAAA